MDSAYRSMDEDDRETSVHIHADASTPIMSSAPSTSTHPPSSSTSTSSSQTILQSDAFTCRGDPANVTLNGNAVTIVTGGETIICPFADMIGCLLRAGRSLSLHSYPYTSPSCFGKPIREHKPIHLRASDDTTAQRWYDAISHVLHGDGDGDGGDEKKSIQQRRILVILNPASGTGQAIRRFQEVEPMFKHSGAHYDVIHTTHAGHAFEITNTLDSTKYDSVVCVSGDGLLSEAVNGLMNRADWQTVVRQVRIGLIGAGSGNGLAKSIVHASNHEYSPTNCAFIVLKGRARYLDLFTVIQPSARPFFGFLSVSWAIISDVDLESDDWRCCGPARFTVAALARMISLRQYHGTLAFVKAEGIETKQAKHPRGFPVYDVCTGPRTCTVCANSAGETQMNELQSYLTQVRPFIGTSDTWTKEDHKQDTPIQFPEIKGTEEKWEEITDDWVSLWGMNVTHAATDMHVAPIAHFSDGTMDLTFMRHGVGRCSLLSMFLDIETASHTNHPHLEYVKVKALRLTPLSQRHSPIDIDGEQIKYAPSEIRIFRGILQLLC